VLGADALPGREEFGGAMANLEREARRVGVTIRIEVEVDAAYVGEHAFDAVAVALGARLRCRRSRCSGTLRSRPLGGELRGRDSPGCVVVEWRQIGSERAWLRCSRLEVIASCSACAATPWPPASGGRCAARCSRTRRGGARLSWPSLQVGGALRLLLTCSDSRTGRRRRGRRARRTTFPRITWS